MTLTCCVVGTSDQATPVRQFCALLCAVYNISSEYLIRCVDVTMSEFFFMPDRPKYECPAWKKVSDAYSITPAGSSFGLSNVIKTLLLLKHQTSVMEYVSWTPQYELSRTPTTTKARQTIQYSKVSIII